ncbi:hypothetical protein CIL03_09160 [Virgibacillus indicus]|uniref:Glyoxalase-like domain-containing protein n=1 Tax=Virgibacillus indicus TaxID=2024554 RepID=A0A265NBK0_9BACI|nr:VOC family protein [Virgibacillus indicus]OZU89165.1 hypothetical protein CIL03_09160 [Virgibacillus indicus]
MLAIDHIIIAAKDPAQAAHKFGQKHNLTTIEGGKHSNWGTYNYLSYFSNDCYIEWLGIFDENLARKSDNPLVQQLVSALSNNIEGMIQFALRTNNMDEYVKHFDKISLDFTGPVPGYRQKPDGSDLHWRMLFPERKLPFLIEWGNGKNVPQDESLINEKQLKSITYEKAGKEYFNKAFQLDSAGVSILLENGKIKFSADQELDFIFE